MSDSHLKVVWVDRGLSPTQKPNPDYPNGMDMDVSGKATRSCKVDLPYPARRLGWFLVDCERCAFSVMLTTAGRPDDPRSLRVACEHNRRLH